MKIESKSGQRDLFNDIEHHPAVCVLAEINPDTTSPRDALALLYRLKSLVKN